MSLVEKIPPLVSALAFGYGVGMAAPDVDLDPAHGALILRTSSPSETKSVVSEVRRPAAELPRALESRLAGEESPLLRELRAARGESRYGEARMSTSAEPGWSREGRAMSSVYADDLAGEASDFEGTDAWAISRLQLPDFGLGVSRQTLKYVRFFTKTDRGRGMFETWLKRSGRYQELVQEEFKSRNLPEDLLWVAMIESGFDATARSPVGAVGLWQFMPATGAVYGLKQNKFIDQRRNPRLATQAAAHHLRDLYLRFGQWDLALAAYNMGYEQLLERIDRVGTTDFNELSRAGVLPEETSKYVPKIVAAAIVANNLERFGFDEVKIAPPVDGAELAVPPRTPLETIARAAGVPTATIRKLNPDLLSKELPPGKGDFIVHVPAESVSRAVAALPGMLQIDRGSDVDEVVDPLDLMSPDGFRPRAATNEESLLGYLPKPKKRRSLRGPVGEDATDALEAMSLVPNDARSPADVGPLARAARSKDVFYRVTSGDSLHGIARDFGLTAVELARANGLETSAILREGALLTIPAATPSEAGGTEGADAPPSSGSGRHTSATRAKRATSG